MPWTITTGTVSGTAGSLITALDLELVTNRGWTKEFTGTNKAAYRNGAGALARKYLRVVDDGTAPTSGAREALVQGYDTMSNVDTGTAQFGSVYWRKSTTADATARTYLAVGDDKTFYLFVLTADVASQYYSHGFGDFYSYKPADNQACFISGRGNNSASTSEITFLWYWDNRGGFTANAGFLLAGNVVGVAGNTSAMKTISASGSGAGAPGTYDTNGLVAYPNQADGAIWVSPYQIVTSAAGGVTKDKVIRGRLRGLWWPLHDAVNFNDGDTFNGAGDLAARSFRILKGVAYGSPGIGYVGAIETTEPESSV